MLHTDISQQITIAPCAICSGTTGALLYETNVLSYALCTACGFVFLMHQNGEDALKKFYRESYVQERNKVRGYEEIVSRLKRKGSYEKKKQYSETFVPHIAHGTRVLEIGTGYGTLLKVVKDATGAIVEGIEPGELGAEVAKRYYGLPVAVGGLEDVFQRDSEHYREQFDVVLLIHVLEHLQNPIEKLRRIRGALKTGGKIIVAVPNLMKPDDPLDRFFHVEHLSYFTGTTLTRALCQSGFRIVQCVPKELELQVIAEKMDGADDPCEYGVPNIAPEQVVTSLQSVESIYHRLRSFKALLGRIFPPKAVSSLTTSCVSILRKFGIIRV